MKWNWQQKDWPEFTYKKKELNTLENQFIQQSGVVIGALKHLNNNDKKQIKIDIICNEALKTSEIEGEYLNRDSLQSSICKHFGIKTSNRKIPPAEKGITEMMLNLYESYNKKLSHKTLYTWHKMLCTGRKDLKDIAKYRTHKEAMQVVSGSVHKPTIHFKAPPSNTVKHEMNNFITWFNKNKTALPPLTRASIAHLYFVCIHPFEDGNGRIGRAVAEMALAESLGHPTLIALSYTIEKHKRNYYNALEQANKKNEITNWIRYFSKTILEAQKETLRQIEFLISKTKFFDTFQNKVNDRQKKVLLRIFQEGTEGFKGGLSANNYIKIAKTSSATASRDLKELVEIKALTKKGELKYTRYYLNI